MMAKIKFFNFALLFAMFAMHATHAQEALIVNKADGSSATSVVLDDTLTIFLTVQNGYSLESRYFIWNCGTEPLMGNISPENFAHLMSYLDLAYEAMQELTGFTPENGRQINIELLAEDDWAGGRGGGAYIGINRDWIGHYMREVERDGGAPSGLFLHELGHNFDWRWFNAEMGATTLAYYVRDKFNLLFYHDYAGKALLGSDWIDLEYTEIINRYNRGGTTKNDYEWDFFVCLWKLFHETNWEPLKAVYHSYSSRFVMWDFLDRLSSFSEIPVDTYFYPDLNKWLHEEVYKTSWEIGFPNTADVVATFYNSTLTINGTGEMQDWKPSDTPWHKHNIKDAITSIIIDNGVTTIGNFAFYDFYELTSVIIPHGVTKIGDGSFNSCCKVSSINIPGSVTYIGEGAFAWPWCGNGFADVTVNWATPLSINGSVFAGTNLSNVNLHIPEGTHDLYAAAPVWKEFKLQTQTNIPELHVFKDFKVFPNPAKDEIFIKSESQIKKVEVYSLTGNLMMSENNFIEKISVSALPPGIYLLEIFTDKKLIIRKIVKDK